MPAAVLALLLFIALSFCPTIADARGNILAVYDVTHASFSWNSSRPTGYGAVPGYRPPPLAHGGNIISSSAWRGVWRDPTGYYQRGRRAYDPESGSWLSFDPQWNALDPSGFSFAGGDPINFDDPNGLWAKWALNEVTGIDLNHQLPWRDQLQAYRQGGAEWVQPIVQPVYKTADVLLTVGAGTLLSADPRLNSTVVEHVGFPIQRLTGAYELSPELRQAATESITPAQDVFFMLGGAARTPSGPANAQARRPGQPKDSSPAPYEFQITHYSDKASGFQNHHGVLDRWAVENIPGYASRAARSPTMRLSIPAHNATRTVFAEFRTELTGKPIAPLDWKAISPRQIQNLSERMFDAANVSPLARADYYRAFHQYIYQSK
jgi:RHS repeat-associated protein